MPAFTAADPASNFNQRHHSVAQSCTRLQYCPEPLRRPRRHANTSEAVEYSCTSSSAEASYTQDGESLRDRLPDKGVHCPASWSSGTDPAFPSAATSSKHLHVHKTTTHPDHCSSTIQPTPSTLQANARRRLSRSAASPACAHHARTIVRQSHPST